MTEQIELRTNHNVRVVTLDTSERVLTIFGEIRTEDEEQRVIGYRLLYPYALSLGEVNDDGTIPIGLKSLSTTKISKNSSGRSLLSLK